MTEKIYLVSDHHPVVRPKALSLSGIFSRLVDFAIRGRTANLVARYPQAQWAGVVSDAVHKALPEVQRSSIQTYTEGLSEATETCDYKPLHQLADDLNSRALEFGDQSGLTHHGASVFRVTETRWIHPILFKCVAPLARLNETLKSAQDATLVTLTNGSGLELAARKIFKSNVAQFKSFSLSNTILERAQLQQARARLAYRGMLDHWLHFTGAGTRRPQFETKTKPRVLFVGYKQRTLQRFEVLLPQFEQLLKADVFLLSNMKGYSAEADQLALNAQHHRVPVSWATDYLSTQDVGAIAAASRKMCKRSTHDFFAQDFKLPYFGADLYSMAKPILEEVACHGSLIAALSLEASRRILEAIEPDFVVHFEEWEINRALTLVAQSKGIKTASFYCLSPDINVGLVRRLPEFFMSSGSWLADAYSSNWPSEKISIVGDPLVDRASRLDRPRLRQKLVDTHRLNSSLPLVLLLTSYADPSMNDERLERYYASALRGVDALGAQLVVKAHPQQDLGTLKSIFERLKAKNPVFYQNTDLLELAASVDIATVPITSATSQVILAGTPVVSFQPIALHSRAQKGLTLLDLADDPSEIFKALIFDPVKRQEHLDRAIAAVTEHTGPVDGKSAERVCAFLNQRLES